MNARRDRGTYFRPWISPSSEAAGRPLIERVLGTKTSSLVKWPVAAWWRPCCLSAHVQSAALRTYRDSPCVVRDQDNRVEDPTNSVVDSLGRGESLVTTLVSGESASFRSTESLDLPDDPDTSAEETGNESVSCPECDLGSGVHGRGEVASLSALSGMQGTGGDLQLAQKQGVHVEGEVRQGCNGGEVLDDVVG